MSDKVYVQTERILSHDQLKDLEYELKKKDENIVLLPYGVKVVKPEVIYCKDCKHNGTEGYHVITNYCKLKHNRMQSDDWFCADGERKEE